MAQAEAMAAEIRQASTRHTELEQSRNTAEARLAFLQGEIARVSGKNSDGEATDQLQELKVLPPVLAHLAILPVREIELESAALHRVTTHMQALGLEYPKRVINAFHTAMKVNETSQMAVLAGISGTGKSQLPRRYAEAMGIGFLQVPVQPRWDSPQDLMGFYNYIEGRFRPTDMARALYHLDAYNGPKESGALQDRMMMVLLDEMNLARVEYYFSDFLSRLESRPSAQGYRVWKSMDEVREHIGNKRRASSCSIPESHVEKLQGDHPDPNAIPLSLGKPGRHGGFPQGFRDRVGASNAEGSKHPAHLPRLQCPVCGDDERRRKHPIAFGKSG